MSTNRLPDPTNLDAVRAWLAEHTPAVFAVRLWAVRQLADVGPVPALGTPAWVALDDQDPRKHAATLTPALAHLVATTPGAIAARLRADLDEFATAWRRAQVEASHAVSQHRSERGYGVGPSHAELVRRRDTVPCPRCRTGLRYSATRCVACGWTEPTPEEIRASAFASWARPATARRGRDAA